jgi:hypothetical protein
MRSQRVRVDGGDFVAKSLKEFGSQIVVQGSSPSYFNLIPNLLQLGCEKFAEVVLSF